VRLFSNFLLVTRVTSIKNDNLYFKLYYFELFNRFSWIFIIWKYIIFKNWL